MNWRELYPAELVAQCEAACDAGQLECAAKYLYDAGGGRASAPPWEHLGDVTRSVWEDRAMAVIYGGLA